MEESEYIFFRTYFEKELLRRAVILLNEKSLAFQLEDRSKPGTARAPLSGYFEADLLLSGKDFDRGAELLNEQDN